MDLNIDLNDLDFNEYGEWPALIKGIAIVLVIGAVGFGWYHFHTKDQIQRLEEVDKRELELKASFEEKQQKAANLDAYRRQLAEMEESFGAMLRQLPDKNEVAALLVDVSQTGLASGLTFELFQPQGEKARDFYAELPIRIRVTGHYHDFGRFVSGLAALPRIVTIHDIVITPTGTRSQSNALDGDGQRLVLQATLKTYRYLEEES